GPLMAKGRHRPMAGHEASVVAHRPQARGYRIQQQLMIASREIAPADRALEQYVADQRQFRFGMMEDNVSGSVARAMPDVEDQLSDGHRVAILQPPVGLERLTLHAVAHAVVLKPRNPETVFLLGPLDRHA